MLEQVTVVSSKVAAAEVALSESALPELRAAVAALGGRAVDTAAAAEWMPAVGIDEEAGDHVRRQRTVKRVRVLDQRQIALHPSLPGLCGRLPSLGWMRQVVEASRAKLRRAATAVTRSTSAAWAALTHHLPHPPETWGPFVCLPQSVEGRLHLFKLITRHVVRFHV